MGKKATKEAKKQDINRRIEVKVLGARDTGKTALVMRCSDWNIFSELKTDSLMQPSGDCFGSIDHKVNGGVLTVIDTDYEEKTISTIPRFVQQYDAIILCFDARNKETLKELRDRWVPEVNEKYTKALVFIIATMCDTYGAGDDLDLEKNDDLKFIVDFLSESGQRGLVKIYGKTSAKDNTRIHELYQEIYEKVMEYRQSHEQ
mmetsp:Transcript_21758/g.24287  ORF Transcript_21758/g.24287 Transcript_21758/m.24287 type:complete len:203 (+) Transcript_21758:119-727(+)